MELKFPENPGQEIDPDIVSKLKRGKVATLAISKDKLPAYQSAGLATGFTVKKIADEGEEFPWLSIKVGRDGTKKQEYDSDGTPKVSMVKVVGQDYVGVSIESPEGGVGHSPFWDNLNTQSFKK